MIKLPRKSVDLSPKSFFWTSKQPFAIYFLLTTCTVGPVAIPEIFSQTQGSDYWQLIGYCLLNRVVSVSRRHCNQSLRRVTTLLLDIKHQCRNFTFLLVRASLSIADSVRNGSIVRNVNFSNITII